MEITEIIKYVAFEEIFATYSLPAVSNADNSIKNFGEWENEIQIDDVNWRYRHDPLNVFKNNSLNDLLVCFNTQLFDYYLEQVGAFQTRQEEEQVNKLTGVDAAGETSENVTADPIKNLNINLDACSSTESESESSDPHSNS